MIRSDCLTKALASQHKIRRFSKNKSAAEHTIAVIQNGRLPSCRCSDRLVAYNAHIVALYIGRAGRVFPLCVAHPDGGAHGPGGLIAQPVEAAGVDLGLKKLFPKGKLYLIFLGVYSGYIELSAVKEPGPALADGVAVNASVVTDDLAVENEISGRRKLGARFQPADVVLVGHKAYLHAVRLLGNGQVKVLGERARGGLFKFAERQDKSVQLLALYAAEHVALVV